MAQPGKVRETTYKLSGPTQTQVLRLLLVAQLLRWSIIERDHQRNTPLIWETSSLLSAVIRMHVANSCRLNSRYGCPQAVALHRFLSHEQLLLGRLKTPTSPRGFAFAIHESLQYLL